MASVSIRFSNPVTVEGVAYEVGDVATFEQSVADRIVASGYGKRTIDAPTPGVGVPASRTTGWRLFGTHDLTKPIARGGRPALADGWTASGDLYDARGATQALALRRTGNVMEAVLAIKPSPIVTGAPGPSLPFSSYYVFEAYATGFNVEGPDYARAITMSLPTPGISAVLVFRQSQGNDLDYPPNVQVIVYKDNGTDFADVPAILGTATWVTSAPFPAVVGGQRSSYDPADVGTPSAPLPAALALFTATEVPSIAAAPSSARSMAIGEVVDQQMFLGYGNYTDNTGAVDIVAWDLRVGGEADAAYVHHAQFRAEQNTKMRRLNDDWLWYVNLDPLGGDSETCDYLITNAPVPGPGGLPPTGPDLQVFRPITGTNPPGLTNMTHVFDVAQTSNGDLYIAGSRNWTAAETAAAAAVEPSMSGDNSMPCVWKSTDGGVTWTEVVKTYYPFGPNPYARIYSIGQIGDRLFVNSNRPRKGDGTFAATAAEDAGLYGYWQMEPDGTWSEKAPLSLDPAHPIGISGYAETPIPRLADSWGTTGTDGSVVFTYTDRLVATVNTSEVGKVGVDRRVPGGAYITLVVEEGALVIVDGKGKRHATDRLSGNSMTWTYAANLDGVLYVCTGPAVYALTGTYPDA